MPVAARLMSLALHLVPWSLRDRIKQLPGVSAVQRWLLSKTLYGKEFAHRVDAGPAKGTTFPVRLPEDKGIWTGTYELPFANCLAASVAKGCVAYDVGSWHGFFAGVMAAQGAGEVHAFEPLPENAELIEKMIALNPAKPLTLHRCALGETDTELDLFVLPETSMAKLESSRFQRDYSPQQKIRVRVRSIDSLVEHRDAPAPALLKIDVEGAEMSVLKGGLNTIRKYRPEIYAEIHSAELLAESIALLQQEGYRVEIVSDGLGAARNRDVHQIRASFSRKGRSQATALRSR
jgi:FkbM family methyltransferase